MQNNDERGLGALLNPQDGRDILLARVQAPVKRPKKYKTDLSEYPVEDQMQHGSCVGQGEGKGAEFFEKQESKKFTRLSKRFLYTECKKIDGNPDSQGTYPRIAAKVLKDIGICSEDLVPDDNDIQYQEYLKVNVTDEIKADAHLHRVGGFAFVPVALEDLAQAIYQNKVVSATLMVGKWTKLPVKPVPARGRHRILFYGYEEAKNGGVPDLKIFFRNSWGDEWGDDGDGWFWFNEYAANIFDVMAYVDIPNEVMKEASEVYFQFLRTVKYGSRGTDITELQKRLAIEKAKDGLPCYRYPTATEQVYTQYFGKKTEEAVQRYQEVKGIVSSGTPETTGYGQLGPTTRASLNSKKKVNYSRK